LKCNYPGLHLIHGLKSGMEPVASNQEYEVPMEEKRIYIGKRVDELEAIFNAKKESIDVLTALSLELDHRHTKVALKLAIKVKEKIINLQPKVNKAAEIGGALGRNTARLNLNTSMLPGLPATVAKWFDDICRIKGINSETLNLNDTVLHIIELAKNAMDYGDTATINVQFTPQCVNIIVEDNGPGIHSPLIDIDKSMGGGYGLRNAFLFSNLFIIETHGCKYEKINKTLALSGSLNVNHGTKVTFVVTLLKEMHD